MMRGQFLLKLNTLLTSIVGVIVTYLLRSHTELPGMAIFGLAISACILFFILFSIVVTILGM
ncbi:hypothetical protein DTL42_13290 [Bremerella cremea]|uniref:Uncharacterized protein n=1 Tax=Bremerella cremea TaxID=1031537 RepID=A0A368KRL3_9BACT|nr:hypothetical protein DTL42_13290 [Bremerella cremea]